MMTREQQRKAAGYAYNFLAEKTKEINDYLASPSGQNNEMADLLTTRVKEMEADMREFEEINNEFGL